METDIRMNNWIGIRRKAQDIVSWRMLVGGLCSIGSNRCITFVCPTELIAFSERAAEFQSRECQVIACSTDSVYAHLAWTKLDRKAGGLGQMNIPLLSDKNLKISRAYEVLDEQEGHAFRRYLHKDEPYPESVPVN
ncbi:unnamed protein product [Schistosoma curassoni]|nr:unnamed protein product [Schistosoma curassoni]